MRKLALLIICAFKLQAMIIVKDSIKFKSLAHSQNNLLANCEELSFSWGNYFHCKDTVKKLLETTKIDYDDVHAIHMDKVSDPLFFWQWGINLNHNIPSYQNNPVSMYLQKETSIESFWRFSKGEGQVVAVLDTGIDLGHDELNEQIYINPKELNGFEGIDDDKNGFIDDIYGINFSHDDYLDVMDGNGHGTHVAGIIAASDNNVGIVGVSPKAKILPIKILNNLGNGDILSAAKGIDYALKVGVKIIHGSWGTFYRTQLLEDAMRYINQNNILYIASAGNSGVNIDKTPYFPASFEFENIIVVGSYNERFDLSDFSNYGLNSVDILAPGEKILSTYRNNDYRVMKGTSMSAPYVTGAIALYQSFFPNESSIDVREQLLNSSISRYQWAEKVSSRGVLSIESFLTKKDNDKKPIGDELEWIKVSINEIETAHPYSPNNLKEWKIKIPYAKYLRVHFDKIDTQLNSDLVEIVNIRGRVIDRHSGYKENFRSSYVDGDTIVIRFRSNSSVEYWGVKSQQVEAAY